MLTFALSILGADRNATRRLVGYHGAIAGYWLRQSPGFAGTPFVEHQCMRMLLAAGNGPLN